MRTVTFLLLLATAIVYGCQESKQDAERPVLVNSAALPDTIIGSRPVSDEIAGLSYRKRATQFFVIVGKDSSDYGPIFTESKEGGAVRLILSLPYFQNGIYHRQRMEELKQILPTAAKEYSFDSLTGVSIGRLVLTGDLAIKITNQYINAVGAPGPIRTADYDRISKFLLNSQLATDFNELFKLYDLSVIEVGVEKVFFTTSDELYHFSSLETDSANVPKQILDFIANIRLKKNK